MQHLVSLRENLHTLAFDYLLPATLIWHHPQNAALRKLRGDGTCLRMGDLVHIPPPWPHHALSTGQRHQIQLSRELVTFSLQLTQWGQPRAHEPYIWIDAQGRSRGTTDKSGWITRKICPRLVTATLELHGGQDKIQLRFCALDPVQSSRGVQQRLANLGYLHPKGSTQDAITRFCRDLDLPNQDPDTVTQALLHRYDQRP